ncbi:unnamed protein product [Anisakis simplex]|uniref:ATG11 domain-containing protein n=1 Tax=Anisakis simplex TaxID=6269 RepID=A0A0M3JYY8_ANISI|nr:unnamed protein product [Anisakis simplex]
MQQDSLSKQNGSKRPETVGAAFAKKTIANDHLDQSLQESPSLRNEDRSSVSTSSTTSSSSFMYDARMLRSYYIGATTSKLAENFVHEPTSFRLYHAIGESVEESVTKMGNGLSEAISPQIHLHIVYKTSNGNFWYSFA